MHIPATNLYFLPTFVLLFSLSRYLELRTLSRRSRLRGRLSAQMLSCDTLSGVQPSDQAKASVAQGNVGCSFLSVETKCAVRASYTQAPWTKLEAISTIFVYPLHSCVTTYFYICIERSATVLLRKISLETVNAVSGVPGNVVSSTKPGSALKGLPERLCFQSAPQYA